MTEEMTVEELDVVSHEETNLLRDIGYADVALRLVLRNGEIRSVTLHWGTDIGNFTSVIDFHQSPLPTQLDSLIKVHEIMGEAITTIKAEQAKYDIVNTTPEDSNGN